MYVFADADRMQQVMHNLLENAMRYTEPGGRIRVRVATAPGEALLEVSDTGVGIPEPDLPYVFERFFRSDRAAPIPAARASASRSCAGSSRRTRAGCRWRAPVGKRRSRHFHR